MLLMTLFVVVRRGWRSGPSVHVACLFVGAWALVLLLFALPIISYAPTTVEAWALLYGSIAATTLGCLAARPRWESPPAPADEQQRLLRATIDPGRLRHVWLGCAVLGAIGFAAFVYAIDRVAGWQAVFSSPGEVRALKRDSVEFQDAYGLWKLLTYFNQVAFVMWTVGIRLRIFSGRWRLAAAAGFVSLIPFVFTGDRNLMAAAIALTCMLHVLWPWNGSLRRVAIVLGLALVIAAAGLTAIGNRYGGSLDDHPEVEAHVQIPALDAVAIPYLYLTANIPTFGKLTEDELAPNTIGQMAVLPAVKAAARAGLVETAPVETGVFYSIPFEAFSNYSWLGSFWLDFRVAGVLLLPLLVGYVATSARLRLAAAPTFLGLWTAAILLYVIAYSPLSNVLSTSLTWQYLLLGPVLSVLLQPGAARRMVARLVARRRVATALGAATLLASAGVVAVASSSKPSQRETVASNELHDAVEKARYVYTETGRYPVPLSLATRLAVSRPGVKFLPQATYSEPLPPPGVIAVFTQPEDVFLRVRGGDGRVYEVHRTEADGGITFGPGTRDR
ncbi:MAG: hypothetical protein AVDCRST_MAG67-394 [uncultured Solirubrobacteraceae bacterium]|uniref:Uncharacterized protein n=1 Tax=uncultured Solirubrobacteraceae bacterium TaxID=1162706 RepID=A0A6J4RUP8_9ACTN|nr:MAG: hypothetical protein AVDCRST_MAG67-394 [uncultured Solirubrobacteraceae bacterium]